MIEIVKTSVTLDDTPTEFGASQPVEVEIELELYRVRSVTVLTELSPRASDVRFDLHTALGFMGYKFGWYVDWYNVKPL